MTCAKKYNLFQKIYTKYNKLFAAEYLTLYKMVDVRDLRNENTIMNINIQGAMPMHELCIVAH